MMHSRALCLVLVVLVSPACKYRVELFGDDETPAQHATDVPLGATPISLPVTGSAAFHSCVLLDTGGVRCWGHNVFGQLGYASTENNIGDDEPILQQDVQILDP